jgi:calcium-dependent protein kinase
METVDHPNIVKYFETYDEPKYIYLCMELCTGGELFEKVSSKDHHLTEQTCSGYMQKLFRALNHCHSQDIIHRDIKPENIMFGRDGEIKLIDFGFAITQHKKKANMEVAGTPYYIAPEVLGEFYGKECDIWSLGVVLY